MHISIIFLMVNKSLRKHELSSFPFYRNYCEIFYVMDMNNEWIDYPFEGMKEL